MTQRTEKVASLIQRIVATEMVARLGMPNVTVTAVDVAPDMRNAVIWVGVLGEGVDLGVVKKRLDEIRPELQYAVSQKMQTKFTPRLSIKLDSGGEYAERISRLIKGLRGRTQD